ncbi:glutathione peroxidase [Litorivita sp. NS0012-18]|uniref:glutathione peroxidase n=1 Tax=Litorivita sp. NS0012-18 TaxID=3127655 RepID=UPI0031088EEF
MHRVSRRRAIVTGAAALALGAPRAGAAEPVPDFEFASIDGGVLRLSAYRGGPVLVVNTASRCGYTKQYSGLQALYDRYRARGLTVLAVPSGDFRQELGSDAEVKAFCELTFGLDLPMTTLTPVRGPQAHPFYAWLKTTAGFEPTWNFNKVLLDGEGRVADVFGSAAKPQSRQITDRITALLDAK